MSEFPHLTRHEIERPLVEMEDILAVQALAMGFIRRRARTRKSDHSARRHGFAMIETGSDDAIAYDGSKDTTMGYTVVKPAIDQWKMSVSFLSFVNTEELARVSCRELYSFDWLRNGNRQAWYSMTYNQRTDESLVQDIVDRHPLVPSECLQLCERMSEMSERVNPLLPESIYRPRYGSPL